MNQNDECRITNDEWPQGFHVTITGHSGVILHAEIDANLRKVRSLALDDATLKSLLIVTSVIGGTVEAEIYKAHQRGEVLS
jgi:hypothetical protein